MVSGSALQVTFLPWTADGRRNESQKRLLSTRRHQHTALAGHRKHRNQQKKLRDHIDVDSSTTTPGYSAQSSQKGIDGFRAVTQNATPLSNLNGSQEVKRLPSPNNAIGLNPFSRFNTFNDVKLSGEFQRVLHDALMHQWPAFALATNENAITKVRQSAFRTSVHSPHALYAMIYAGACYQSYFRDAVHDPDLLQLQSKQEALKHLRVAVEHADGEVTDEMLMTIALLAIHGSVRPQHKPRFTTPFYRDNEFYCSVEFDQTHLRALRTLVSQRGGLAKLGLGLVVNIISMIDTFQSLMNLSKPHFDSLYPAEPLIEYMQKKWDDTAWNRFLSQEDGFEFLNDYQNGSQLHQIICRIRILLETYSLSLRDHRQGPDLMMAVHTRRSLQHAALRLGKGEDCLHEAARLASIIFLAELGWTLPVVGGFQARATQLLLDALQQCTQAKRWRTQPEFLSWVTVVGGLAARQTSKVQDFASNLRYGPIPVTKDSWLQIKSLSLKFLPFEHELTGICHSFWDEACDLQITGRVT